MTDTGRPSLLGSMANKSEKGSFYNGYSGSSAAVGGARSVTGHSSSSVPSAAVGRAWSVTGHSSSSVPNVAVGGAQSVTGHSSSSVPNAAVGGARSVTGHSSSSVPNAAVGGARSVTGHSSSFPDRQQSSTARPSVASNNTCNSKFNRVPVAEGGLTSSGLVRQYHVKKCKADPCPHGYSGPTVYGERHYDTKLGINVRIYSGDISKCTANAITTSEGCQVMQKSQVTKSISNLRGSRFEETREKLFSLHGGLLQEGKVYDTQITGAVKYQHVLHAVIDSKTKDNMSELYRRVFKRADELNVKTVAVPLLGAGRGHMKAEHAVSDLAFGLHYYATQRPKNYTNNLNVEFVTLDVKHVDMIYEEIEKSFTSPKESASALHCGTSMSKMTAKKQPQSSAADTSDCGKKTLRADAHQHPDGSKAHKTGPRLRSHRCTTIRNGTMVAASENEKASVGTLHTPYDESEMTNLEARTGGLSLGGDVTSRKAVGHHRAADAINTSLLGCRGQYNQFDEHSSSAEDEDKLDERNIVSPEKQPEPEETDVEEEICPICMDVIQNSKILDKCGHKFCKECIDDSFRSYKPVCPSCLTVYDIIRGNMPQGTMSMHKASFPSLPGYEGSGIITIQYHFPSGTQTKDHPHPGRVYHGTSRVAFLPNNKEGEKVYRLLKLAFDRKLTFTVGRSATTGRDDVVTWNDIHHKTSIDGGPTRFGYPDETYLSRVQEELACKGVTVDQL
ncbi:uncharacterized protein [Haliotis asinina]|uniref:uncharacterized protein isoform X2 n=1 Tax=Haliotis asinina TaxID=109174 RepID=UPI0035324DDC